MKLPSTEIMVQLTLWLGLLLGLVVVCMVVVQRFRGSAAEKDSAGGQVLANFQEMHSRGDISDADYRKIKSVLGAQLHSELRDGKDKL